MIEKGQSHNDALQSTYKKFKVSKFITKPFELPPRKELLKSSKGAPGIYPLSESFTSAKEVDVPYA